MSVLASVYLAKIVEEEHSYCRTAISNAKEINIFEWHDCAYTAVNDHTLKNGAFVEMEEPP
jgi:hypothetical protein